MKKHTIIAILIALITGLTACSDDNYNALDISGEVKILSFTVNGSKLDILDEKTDYIEIIMPGGTDLTTLVPTYTLSAGASIALPEAPNSPTNLSVLTTYRVVNKNLYHDYKVLAKTVDKITSFTDFAIGTYKGVIDNDVRTIVVKLPLGSDVTALRPTFNLSEGAELTSPNGTTHDFTNPVKYTISYLGENFTYDVTVQLVDFRKMAFLGAPATAMDITDADEKTAYEWFTNNFPVTEYVSFADIKAGKELNDYSVIWYHYSSYRKGGDPAVASEANDPKIIESLNNYLYQGGGLYLSSAAMALGHILDVAKDGKMWNNAWGYDNNPFEVNDGNGIGWGVRVKNPAHPVFKNIQWNTGETHRFFLVSNGAYVRGHNIRWNFFADWDGNDYKGDVARWEATNGGRQLATLHWDDAMNQVSILTEYPGENGKGTVITNGAECYLFAPENNTINKYQKNVETLTYNIINYLSE